MITAAKSAQCGHHPPKLEPESVDALTARVFHSLGKVMHLNRLLMTRMIAQGGVHHAEIMALPLLSSNEGVSQRELAQILHLSTPRVSMVLRFLEKGGSVERRADATDRRLTRVYLTDEGRRRQKQQQILLGEYVNRTIGALSERDRSELARLLDELADRTAEVLKEEHVTKSQGEDDKPR